MPNCTNNNFITRGSAILIQITFIFTFVTLFFFFYITEIEKQEFQQQINIIVDDIIKDFDTSNIFSENNINQDIKIASINGILDLIKYKNKHNNHSHNKQITQNNNNVFRTSIITLVVILGITFLSFILVRMLGYCLPVLSHFKEAIIALVAVAATELFFLQVISSRYISADPNYVRQHLAKAIKNYIDKR